MSAVAVSNPDKVLSPAAGFTKAEMVAYYETVAPVLLPHLAGRPVTLWRAPDGVEGPNWYQNELPGRPAWLRTTPVTDTTGKVWRFCLVEDLRTLLWVANLGTIELHPLQPPTLAVFDLDPGPPADIVDCCRVALAVRDALGRPGIAALAKTSGSVGLHVYAPLGRERPFERIRSLVRDVAAQIPGIVLDHRRAARAGNVYVDWRQNDGLRSTVAPYSLRGTGWPTVSTPVTWAEIERCAAAGRPELLVFDAPAVLERVRRHGDLFR